MESAISISGLNHYFGAGALRKQILFDITADVQPGEIVINTGPSGSGKTTMLTLVCGLRSVQEGSVRTLGTELNGATLDTLVRVRRSIGFIFQAHNLLDALTACQNVQMGLQLEGTVDAREARERSVKMLEAVGLEHRIDHYPRQLSGGQKQRVAIARALVRRPKIVLADEPTAALDKASGREVVDLLQKLAREEHCAILLVTHDNRILDIADRILTLEDGRISSFTEGIAANSEHMVSAYTGIWKKGTFDRRVEEVSDGKFTEMIGEVTAQFETMRLSLTNVQKDATQALLDQVIRASATRIRELVQAERATVYIVDRAKGRLRSRVADHAGAAPLDIELPVGTGIAGLVAQTGESLNIPDAYSHPAFNPDVDRRTGFRTQAVLCMPIFNPKNEVVAVAQLLNKRGAPAFNLDDERRFREFAKSLGITLETCSRLMAS